MTAKRIPQLDSLSSSGAASGDQLVIFDTDANATKRILRSDLYSASSGSALVGYTQGGSGASARNVQNKLRETVSVKDFGAVGDGVTDDGAALLAATTYANSTGDTLVFPYGIYLSSSALTFDRIVVQGNNATIKFTGISNTTDCITLHRSSGARSLTIIELNVDANNTGRDAVRATGRDGCDYLRIDKLNILNAARDGFHVEPEAAYAWFEDFNWNDLRVFSPGRHGVSLVCPNYLATFINQGVITNCEVRDAGRLLTGYDVFVQNANNNVGGKIAELTWISGEFDATLAGHGQHSFYFDDARSPQGVDIGLGSWVFIGCTFESTTGVIVGFPAVFGVSSGTKLDSLQVFGGVVAQYGDVVTRPNAVGVTTIRTSSRYYDYYNRSDWKSWYDNVSNLYLQSAGVLRTDGEFSANKLRTPLLINPQKTYSGNEFISIGGQDANTNAVGIYNDSRLSVTNTTYSAFSTFIQNVTTANTVSSVEHYKANAGYTAGSLTISAQYGFVASAGLNGATNNYAFFADNYQAVTAGKNVYGFYSAGLAATGGGNTWQFYAAGSAPNFFAGDMRFDKTVTAGGTTGAQTINKNAGTVNFAAAATSLVVTNNRVTTSSIIIATVASNDATMTSVQAVAGSGSFTLYANAAATGETRVNWVVIN